MSTALCSEVETSRGKSADELFDLYDHTLRRITDNFAPASTSTRRIRRLSPWFDNDCRSERRKRDCSSGATGSPEVMGIEVHG